jgi:hypothetical protein
MDKGVQNESVRSVGDEIRTGQTGTAKAKTAKTLLSTLFRSFFHHSLSLAYYPNNHELPNYRLIFLVNINHFFIAIKNLPALETREARVLLCGDRPAGD